jgi:hypothetical protein
MITEISGGAVTGFEASSRCRQRTLVGGLGSGHSAADNCAMGAIHVFDARHAARMRLLGSTWVGETGR